MSQFMKRSIVVEATRWFQYGDHPKDYADARPYMERGQFVMKPGAFFEEKGYEGAVVRYFRHPGIDGTAECPICHRTMHVHGLIDRPPAGMTVCPGDWIITEQDGVNYYPCHPDVFEATYTPALADTAAS